MNYQCEYGVVLAMLLLLLSVQTFAENIDPYNTGAQYSWSENTGWLNLEPSVGSGVQVSDDKLVGWIWDENIGWINLSCENTGYCGTVEFGVVHDGKGNLSGLAWAKTSGGSILTLSCPAKHERMNTVCELATTVLFPAGRGVKISDGFTLTRRRPGVPRPVW